MPLDDEGRPPTEAAPHTAIDSHILSPMIPASASVIDHCHAVLVATPSGRVTRRLFLSMHAADKALARARARGQVATCVMVELRVIDGGDR